MPRHLPMTTYQRPLLDKRPRFPNNFSEQAFLKKTILVDASLSSEWAPHERDVRFHLIVHSEQLFVWRTTWLFSYLIPSASEPRAQKLLKKMISPEVKDSNLAPTETRNKNKRSEQKVRAQTSWLTFEATQPSHSR